MKNIHAKTETRQVKTMEQIRKELTEIKELLQTIASSLEQKTFNDVSVERVASELSKLQSRRSKTFASTE